MKYSQTHIAMCILALLFALPNTMRAQVGVSSILLYGGPTALKISDNSAIDIQSNMTVEAWINPCTLDTHNIIASKQRCTGPYYSWTFSIRQGLLQFTWDDIGDCNGTNIYRANGNPILADEWTHVAVVHTNSSISLYINGSLVSGTLVQGSYTSIRSGIADLYIGAYLNQSNNTPQSFFQGRIDDFRIWAQARSVSDINALMNTALAGTESGLRAYYNMEPSNVLPTIKNNCLATGSALDATATASTSNTASITPNSKDLNNLDLGNDTTVCFGDTILLSARDAGLNYTWYPNASNSTDSLPVYQTNTYSVTASLTSGAICSRSDTIQVNFNKPQPDLGPDTSLCADEYILDAGDFAQAEWNTGVNNRYLGVTTSGTYAVTVTDTIGCEGYGQVVVNISPPLIFDLGDDRNICRGDQVTLSGPPNMSQYNWSTGASSESITTTTGGLFWLTAYDPNGCDFSDTVRIEELDVEYIDFSLDTVWCQDEIIQFGLPPESDYWLDGSAVSGMVSIYDTGRYELRVLNTCADNVFPLVVTPADHCPCYLNVPSAFTPNSDGHNDVFRPKSDCDLILYELVIIDRWGNEIFKSLDLNNGWDGSVNEGASLAQEGFYSYRIRYSSEQGHRHETVYGRVYLIQ